MNKSTRKAPEIRFKGFSEDWEQRKFQDFTKLSQGLQIAIDKRFLAPGKNRVFYITNEFLNPNSNRRYYIKSPSKSIVAGKEDILMTRTGNTGKIVTNVEGAFHNNFFKITYMNNEIAKLFLYYLLNSFLIQKEIIVRAGTSTIPDLNHNDFYKIKVNVPVLEEQQKIGSLLKQLNNTITLHQRKLDLLKQLKQGYLQNMFPQNGESVPKLRFANFDSAWEQHKLGEVLKVNSGRDYKHLNEGEIPVYGTGGYMLSVDDRLSNVDGIGIGRKGTIDKPQYLKAPFWTVDTLFFMTPMVDYDLQFLFSMSQSIKWKRMDESTGVPSLSKAVIEKVSRNFPSFKEQTKIGLLFKMLDDTICLHQSKLEKLQSLKKVYLQKMFI